MLFEHLNYNLYDKTCNFETRVSFKHIHGHKIGWLTIPLPLKNHLLMLKFIVVLLLFTFILYGAVCFLLYKNQEQMIFFPETLAPDHEFTYTEKFEERFFKTASDANIHALHFKTEQAKGLILYFHGNAGSLEDWGLVAQQFLVLGYDILMPDYRTYGKSTGKLSEQALYDDALFIYNAMKSEYKEDRIVLYGRSLGSGIVSELATKTKPRQIILESPLYSAVELAKQRLPLLPVRKMMRYRFDNHLKIKQFKSPFHVFHGTKDEVIPYEHCQKLMKAFSPIETYLTSIEGGGHNNLSVSGLYHNKLEELLK